MGILSNTGLLASTLHPVQRFSQTNTVQLQTLVRPAPFILKPLAGLYNPYPASCSLLCNHPTPTLPVPVIKTRIAVPEELFRKYTETDSRPMTPTPTIISATTTGVNRRCLTPQPLQRPKLIVDLRRTHSQETLSWTVYSEQCRSEDSDKSSKCSTPRSVINNKSAKNINQKNLLSPQKSHRSQNGTPRTEKKSRKSPRNVGDEGQPAAAPATSSQGDSHGDDQSNNTSKISSAGTDDGKDDDDDMPRRRGRRRKARSRAGTAIKTADKDPETQVASILLDLDSSCDLDVIKILQRELTQEIIDAEFDTKKKLALEEAFRCLYGKNCLTSSKLDEYKVCNANMDLWLNLPRNYSVRSARFELPIDNDEFERLTPLEYIQNYVTVTEKRKTLYNFIFNRYKEDTDDCNGRFILGKNIIPGLGEIMGRPLNMEQSNYIRYLLNWDDNELYNFRMWSSICVLCERLFAHEYWPSNPMDKSGNEMERVDFESLPRKLLTLKIHPQLEEILLKIRNT
ncbi:uncharacterized protein LOC123306144 [Chrysoperla carnea]|uniref:uncharacterized protein LOC123306144 n=1 Tax=Chrysoperla carnea TaxID=189513 RepID=UPI001D07EFBA|nr:uncharacterized protein LOC123306144 [Chrysoperla carnea]